MIEQQLVTLRTSEGRVVEVSLFLPPSNLNSAIPVIFSHGANSSPQRYRLLFDAWAAAGFLICAPLHIDSDDHPQRSADDRVTVRRTRMEDFALIATALADGTLGARATTRYVAAGHSYGALIAQVAGGAVLEPEAQASMPALSPPACVIALSPPPPMPELATERSWSAIAVPMLCVTGTRDVLPGFVDDWRLHLASHRAASRSFGIVFDDMDHYFNGAFGRLGNASCGTTVVALNDTIAGFAKKCFRGSAITPKYWISERTPGALRLV